MSRRKMDPAVSHALAVGSRFLARGTALVAIDPGASTGWCVRWTNPDDDHPGAGQRFLESGQDEPAAAAKAVLDVLGCRPIGLLVIEEPFMISRGNQWKLAWAGGELRGRLAEQQVEEAAIWTPKPSSWRYELGLAKGKRGEVNDAVHAWAEEKLGVPLRTRTGAPEYDRASAVALSFAAEIACSTVAAG